MGENAQKAGCRIDREVFDSGEGEKVRHGQSWRTFRIISEFVAGFELLQKYPDPAITFFGSSKQTPQDAYYQQAEQLARRLAKERGFVVITGGGPGIMEAGNKGAFEAGGKSVGLNIKLPEDQPLNKYTTEAFDFSYFFSRKVMLTFASEIYIFFPGGLGTLDEFFELVTLVQNKKIQPIPIILYGKEYWEPLLGFIKNDLYEKYGMIDKEDMDIYQLVDSVDEAFERIAALVSSQ